MSESMIERVASQIERLIDERPMVDAPQVVIRKIMAQKIARAAIEEMRVPTEAMVDAGWDADGYDRYAATKDDTYRAMIDAALED